MRRPTSETDLAWVVKAKAHDLAYPQLAAFADKESHWPACVAWYAHRLTLERTAPQQRVTAAELAAYEDRR
jgi:hypothetical protein